MRIVLVLFALSFSIACNQPVHNDNTTVVSEEEQRMFMEKAETEKRKQHVDVWLSAVRKMLQDVPMYEAQEVLKIYQRPLAYGIPIDGDKPEAKFFGSEIEKLSLTPHLKVTVVLPEDNHFCSPYWQVLLNGTAAGFYNQEIGMVVFREFVDISESMRGFIAYHEGYHIYQHANGKINKPIAFEVDCNIESEALESTFRLMEIKGGEPYKKELDRAVKNLRISGSPRSLLVYNKNLDAIFGPALSLEDEEIRVYFFLAHVVLRRIEQDFPNAKEQKLQFICDALENTMEQVKKQIKPCGSPA